MSVLSVFKRPDAPASIEECLDVLRRYGKTHLLQTDSGTWHASVKIFVRTPGATFEVATGFKHASAAEAMRELVSLTLKAVTAIGETS